MITALVLLQAEASAIVAERQAERRVSHERSASHDRDACSTRSIGGTLSSDTFTPSRAAAPRVSHCAASGGLVLIDSKQQCTAPVQPCSHVQAWLNQCSNGVTLLHFLCLLLVTVPPIVTATSIGINVLDISAYRRLQQQQGSPDSLLRSCLQRRRHMPPEPHSLSSGTAACLGSPQPMRVWSA